MDEQPSRLRQLFAEIDAKHRLRRDVTIMRQGIHAPIESREDLLAALGRPVSAELSMKTSEHTAQEAEHIAEMKREKRVPSYNELWDQGFDAWALTCSSDDYVRGHARNWNNHVRDSDVARMPMNQVTEDMAQTLIANLSVGQDGQRKVRSHFKRLSRKAVKRGVIAFCPFEDAKLSPKRTTKDDPTKFYHPADEYPLILEHARDDDAREFFGFSMGCGPRPNEGKAFRWEDIDLKDPKKSKLTFRYGREGRATKTGKPYTVAMMPEARLWLVHRINRLHGGTQPTGGVIFCKTNGGSYAKNYNFGLNETLAAANTDPQERGLYGFRHGFCVALANNFFGEHWGKDQAQVLMRHSSRKTTDTYYHLLDGPLQDKAANAIALTNIGDYADESIPVSPQLGRGDPARISRPLLEVR